MTQFVENIFSKMLQDCSNWECWECVFKV